MPWAWRQSIYFDRSRLHRTVTKINMKLYSRNLTNTSSQNEALFMNEQYSTNCARSLASQLKFSFVTYMNWQSDVNSKHKRARTSETEVVGINDKELSENLQLKSDLELETAIQIVRQSEVVKSQIKDQSAATARELEEVTSRHGDRRRKFNKSSWTGSCTNKWYDKPQSQYTDLPTCENCNRKHHRDTRCPAVGKRCRGCNKYNHFQVCCKSPKTECPRLSRSRPSLDSA